MMQKFMRTRNVILEIYEGCKYVKEAHEKESVTVKYENVVGFEVVSGEKAREIEKETDGSCIDEYHEYLVIYFENGETSTFRNSHVDMFPV